jgi:ribosomal-protein-alanine N-acetyltransferase
MQRPDLPFEAPLEVLETPRLLLRVDTAAVYMHLYKTTTDDELKSYFGIVADEELQTQKAKVIGGMTTHHTSILFFHLIEKARHIIVGSFAFHNWYPMHRRSEIGYAVSAAEHKNKGFMKEAFPHMINYGFERMDLNRIEAFIHPENGPSRRLVEGVGFQREGLLKEHYFNDGKMGDSIVYGMLRDDYRHLCL